MSYLHINGQLEFCYDNHNQSVLGNVPGPVGATAKGFEGISVFVTISAVFVLELELFDLFHDFAEIVNVNVFFIFNFSVIIQVFIQLVQS